jgi:peptidoglycan/xylan/chitin deacetylase (PgdA/CDA1 family)
MIGRSVRVLLPACLVLLASACAQIEPAAVPPPDGSPRATGRTFESEEFIVVVAGESDTAEGLAAKHLGSADQAWRIQDFNGANAITPGQQVVIPKRPWNLSGVDTSGYQLVPILVYHNIAAQAKGRMIISARSFAEQMRYLKSQGYRVVALKDFVEFISLKKQLPRKSVVVSFDDGYRSFLQFAYPVLKELGFTATLFVYTDFVGAGSNAISWADLKKLKDEGFEIHSHSKTHADLRRGKGETTDEYTRRINRELAEPKEMFHKHLAHSTDVIAYPYGRQDEGVVERAKQQGYSAGFTVYRQGSPAFVDRLRIHRSQIYSEMSLEDFIKNLNTFNPEPLR